MSIKEENELLISLTQQSAMLRRTLDDLNGIWSDEAARTLNSKHLSPHLVHDEHILRALATQTELHFQGDGLIDAANQHIAEAGIAHRSLDGHLLYAQQQMDDAENKRRDSLLLQQEVRDMLQRVQQLLREANS
jgi:hypothetical protein